MSLYLIVIEKSRTSAKNACTAKTQCLNKTAACGTNGVCNGANTNNNLKTKTSCVFSASCNDENSSFLQGAVFGIIAVSNGKIVKKISNITTDYCSLQKTVRLLNSEGLSPLHLDTVIEEFLMG